VTLSVGAIGAVGLAKAGWAAWRGEATREMFRELSITRGDLEKALDGRYLYALAALDVDGQSAPAPVWKSVGDFYDSPRANVRAAAYGNLPLLKLLRARGVPFLWDARVCEAAVEHGHLAVVKWLRALNPPTPVFCTGEGNSPQGQGRGIIIIEL